MQNHVRERIEKRKKDARDKGIFGKSAEIARRLGTRKSKRHGAYHIYEERYLYIVFDDYGPNLSIRYMETPVFDYHLGTIETYRPDMDGWIQTIEKLYDTRVRFILDEIERQREEDRVIRNLDKWGIKDE